MPSSTAARPLEPEPVALALHDETELRGVDGDHAHRLALRPVDGGHRRERRAALRPRRARARGRRSPIRRRAARVRLDRGTANASSTASRCARSAARSRRAPTVSPPIAAISRARPLPGVSARALRRRAAPRRAAASGARRSGESSARSRDSASTSRAASRVIGVHLEMPGERAQGLLQLVVRDGRHGRTSPATSCAARRCAAVSRITRSALRRIAHHRDHVQRLQLALRAARSCNRSRRRPRGVRRAPAASPACT